MTNDEARMTKECRMSKPEKLPGIPGQQADAMRLLHIQGSSFVLRHSFVIRHWSFVIPAGHFPGGGGSLMTPAGGGWCRLA
jgi:hypothetical protein